MKINFFKYQSSGNNFILIDCINQKIYPNKVISSLVKDPLVIKSDGILFVQKSKMYDFDLTFFNPDGSKGFCGNGSLCSLHYFSEMNMNCKVLSFSSFGKEYLGKINNEISLKINDISTFECFGDEYFINSGAPHHIKFVDDPNYFDLKFEADRVRKMDFYLNGDCNVNLVSNLDNDSIYVRTFEKGVERETLSCGTGAVASTIAFYLYKKLSIQKVISKGGELKVIFNKSKLNHFSDIYLIGNPSKEFSGVILI